MNISVENLTSVDKKITIEADNTDLAPKIDKALREYRKTMNLPGFRQGKAPIGLVRKRIGKEVEAEQIDKFIQDVYQKDIAPEHKPVGEPQIDKLDFNNGKLLVEINIGVQPEIELIDLKSISIDKLVHDVTDDEVELEYQASIRRHSEWEETEEAANEDSKVTVDVIRLDNDGKETEDKDNDLVLDLKNDQNKEYADVLVGKKKGDEAEIKVDEDGEKVTYKASVKKVENQKMPELNEEFFKNISRGSATDEDSFRTFLKSQIQNYFDQTSDDLLNDKIAGEIIEKHDFEIPKNIYNDILNTRISNIMRENDNELPEDFNKEAYEEENREGIIKEGKWSFLVMKLMEKYPETEITPEDVDNFFQVEAAKMGLPAEMLKNFYASQSDQLENLRMRIRTNKLFGKLSEEISVVELSKEDYEKKYSKKKN